MGGRFIHALELNLTPLLLKIMGGAMERWRAKAVNRTQHQWLPLSAAGFAQHQWLQHSQARPGLWMHPRGAATTQSHALS